MMRSTSSAFFRAMMNKSGAKSFMEPYALAYYFGTDRCSERFSQEDPQSTNSFSNIRQLLEQSYEGHSVVFAKDMAYAVTKNGRYTLDEVLPSGYQHTFLIRDPRKTVLSMYKLIQKKVPYWQYYDSSEMEMKNVYDLFMHVTQTLKQPAVVIDSDDLLANPEAIMKEYCRLTNITYEDSMVHWEHPVQDMTLFKDWDHVFFDKLLSTSTFQHPPPAPREATIDPSLPEHIQCDTRESLVYYNKLFSMRITY